LGVFVRFRAPLIQRRVLAPAELCGVEPFIEKKNADDQILWDLWRSAMGFLQHRKLQHHPSL
jgi:hypothetical protein